MTANIHRRTPSLSVRDGRGLPIRQIAYLRSFTAETATALATRQQHNAAGRLTEQWDPRLSRPNIVTIYSLSGKPLKVDSVDAGWRLSLPGLAGEALARWDARGNHWRTTYDNQLRVIALEENTQPNVEIYTYATVSADASHNLRGQLLKQVDPSGSLHLNSYGLLGQPLHETRTSHDAKAFTSSRTYNPQGAVLEQIDAGEHLQQMFYDIAGQLKKSQLRLKPGDDAKPILEDSRYNAAGQIIEQQAGNGVVSTWAYEEADGRLDTLTSGVPGQDLLQHFQYLYDRVGNTLRIDDLAFKPVFFANQLIDGHREFTYNSLYQLTSATGHDATPGSDLPGRPLPNDPNNRLNYKQTYAYDDGGNLIKLVHERAVGGYTHQMFIDPNSNRGVRHKEGDPAPDFDSLFDRHGNLQASSPGRPLHWNNRDQLSSATLVSRENGLNDEETYRYSQGARVFKRHETHTSSTTHFHQVIYLPGLEIRTRDNGEELHVIAVPGGRGSVRCLHWVNKKPDGIDQDQLRYSLDDHLGSSLMELDQTARLVSHESYYPFGGTAWLTADSALEVSYKTLRYSGKEMDVSGFYHYGLRYYAPWLQRWINPDPLGTVDGLNLYQMVGNNPINFVDEQGATKNSPPLTPAQTTINMSSPSSNATSPSSSRKTSVASSTPQASNSPALVDNPEANPPGHLPPKPEQSWREWGKGRALAVVNSKVGLAVLPTATSSPSSPVIVTVLATNAALFIVNATLFNPGWSIASTWPQAEDGIAPSYEVTQAVNRNYQLTLAAANLVAAAVGAPLALLVGGYVDELRGTKVKADNKAQAGKWMDKIDSLIAEQRLVDEVSVKAQTSLREQVLEVEELIGITWQTMGMLEKITGLRSGNISESNASSRRGSISSQSTGDSAFRRRETSRTPIRKTNILR